MDELYRAGIRPTEAAGSNGQLAATREHLADMRAIVFPQVTAAPAAPKRAWGSTLPA